MYARIPTTQHNNEYAALNFAISIKLAFTNLIEFLPDSMTPFPNTRLGRTPAIPSFQA